MRITPSPENEQARSKYRVAVLAFRKQRQLTWQHFPCHRAAVDALLAAFPELSETEASKIAVDAVAYAFTYHNEWIQRGAAKSPWDE